MTIISVYPKSLRQVTLLKNLCKEIGVDFSLSNIENPSPSGDIWWNIPENRNEIEKRFKDIDEGKTQFVRLSRDELRKVMGL